MLFSRSDEEGIYKFEAVSLKNVKETSWEVKNLKKYHRYSFVVQAFNAFGPGPLSAEVFAITLEDGMYFINPSFQRICLS